MKARLCPVCLAPICRAEGESPRMFAARRTCASKRCIESYRGSRPYIAARHSFIPSSEFVRIGEWPPGMAARQPFADNVPAPRFSPPRLAGPASLAGGCSSSSGWGL